MLHVRYRRTLCCMCVTDVPYVACVLQTYLSLFVAYRGLSAVMSGRPIAAMSLLYTESPVHAINELLHTKSSVHAIHELLYTE